MPIGRSDSLAIAALRSVNVDKTFYGLNQFIKNKTWVGKNNSYILDTVKKIQAELKTGGIRNSRQLSQYIAASCLLHCADGWSYLGRSIVALLQGDPHRSCHLAYYAELRAAMSLLATQGIGVFDRKHLIFDRPRSVVPLKGEYSTHQFAWDSLKFWSNQPSSGVLFSNVVRPRGISLDDWFAPIGGANAIAPQAERWFQQWGMDLKLGFDDRNARNESSYRPDGLLQMWKVLPKDVVNFVSDLWTTLEPSADSRFDVIDKYILRFAFETYHRGTKGSSAKANPSQFRQLISRVLDGQNFSAEVRKLWEDFLTRETSKRDPVIFHLSSQPPTVRGESYAGIIARAALLLRVSSGATLNLIKSADLAADSMTFWWDNLGISRGLWEGSKNATDLLDLWSDIELLLKEVEKFQSGLGATDHSFLALTREFGRDLIGFGSCERVAIWSMTP